MKILIVDDSYSNRLILSDYLEKDGNTVVFAENGREAIAMYQTEEPALILMKIIMPVMDGYEATRIIKSKMIDTFIPIVFLTAESDEKVLTQGIEAGGDDFLIEPYKPAIIKAKIDALKRLSLLYNTVSKQKHELVLHKENERQEQEVARKVFDSILNPGCLSAANIQLHLSPLSLFNGDVVLAAIKPTGGLHVLFGDFTGHGLAASLGALPVSDIFYSMTGKGYSINDVVQEINHKLQLQLPTGMFLAACLVEVDTINNVLKYWNAAIPGAFLHKGNSLVRLESQHLPLGILDDAGFSDKIEIIELHDNDRIILSTDGILEAENSDGEMFGLERFVNCLHDDMDSKRQLSANKIDLFQHILDTLKDFTQKQAQTDDVTLGVISCDIDYINKLASQKRCSKNFVSTHWKSDLVLYYDTLKSIDPVPLINQIMREIQGHQIQQDNLSIVLTELFCNSLDHGLLELDSNIKATPEGFIQFYTDKESRLAKLESGFIHIIISNEPTDTGGILTIVFEDSGKGFDVEEVERQQLLMDKNTDIRFSGRGILLVKKFCRSVNYNESGNRVECVYPWSDIDC